MTQEFRIFTQRLTDKPNKTTRIFNVRAKTIVDQFGNDVVDDKGSKIWFPENFDPAAAIAFGKSLASESTLNAAQALSRAVKQGGPWDLQRSFDSKPNSPFASLFTNAASYTFGLIGAAAGFSPTTLVAGGGLYNLWVNPETAGPKFGNNPNNPPFILKGVGDFFASAYAPPAVIPNDTFKESSMFVTPADRFRTTFDRNNGASGDSNRFLAAAADGNITPSVGFAEPIEAILPHALDSATSSSARDGWLSSMLRNGEANQFMRGKAMVSGSHNSTGFDDRFGRWASFPSEIGEPAGSDGPVPFDLRFGIWSRAPAGGMGEARSPVSRELERYRRSISRDGLAPASIHGAPTPAFEPDATYSPAGDFFGNFPHGSEDAAIRTPIFFVGSSPINSAGTTWPTHGAGAADFSGEDTSSIDSPRHASSGLKPAVYRLQGVNSALPDVAQRAPELPMTTPYPEPSLGIFSGEPILPFPPALWDFPG